MCQSPPFLCASTPLSLSLLHSVVLSSILSVLCLAVPLLFSQSPSSFRRFTSSSPLPLRCCQTPFPFVSLPLDPPSLSACPLPIARDASTSFQRVFRG